MNHLRIREVDVLRGIAIILMITGHSFIIHPIDIHEVPWCMNMHNWIYSFHMELFFILAGCVYHCSNYRKYLSKKIERLVIPYSFFGLISLAIHSIGLNAVNRHTGLAEGFVNLLIRGGSYWFLYALFVLYLIYPFIEYICSKPWMEIGFAVLCILLYELLHLPGIFLINKVVYYLPYFVLGRYLVKLLQSERLDSHKLNILLLFLSLFTYYIIFLYDSQLSNIISIRYLRAVSMILCIYVPMHYLLRWADNGSKFALLTERFLNKSSKYSLQLYLFNGFILVFIRTLLVSVFHIYIPSIIVLTLVVGNLIITLLICNYVLPKTKWLAWLCGTGERPWTIQ